MIAQETVPILEHDNARDVFEKLVPLAGRLLRQAVPLLREGKAPRRAQDESQASYEGWCRAAEARIDWAKPIDHVHNLIRGCNPAPGAWTTLDGKKLQIFDCRKVVFRRFADVPGKIGEVTEVTSQSFNVTAQGGLVEVLKAKLEDGKKLGAGELAHACGIKAGSLLSS